MQMEKNLILNDKRLASLTSNIIGGVAVCFLIHYFILRNLNAGLIKRKNAKKYAEVDLCF